MRPGGAEHDPATKAATGFSFHDAFESSLGRRRRGQSWSCGNASAGSMAANVTQPESSGCAAEDLSAATIMNCGGDYVGDVAPRPAAMD